MSEEIIKHVRRWLQYNEFAFDDNVFNPFFFGKGQVFSATKDSTEYMIFKSKEKLTFRLVHGRTTAYNSISLINIHKVKKIHRMFKIVMEREK